MKKNILGIFLLFVIFSISQAQTDSSFTLQQCIDYALKNQSSILNAEIDEKISTSKVGETRAIGYPRISGTAQVLDNTQLKRMFLKNGGNPLFTDPSKPIGSALAIPNLFQLRSYGDASLTASQLIFDGSYIVGLQAASTYRELAHKSVAQTKIQTIESVTKSYYGVLIGVEQSKSFNVNLVRLDSSLYQTKLLLQTGLAEDIDVKRLEVQYNNLLTDKQNSENLLELNKLQLKLNMGMPLDEPIFLKDSLSSFKNTLDPIATEQFAPTQRIEYSLMQTQQKLQALDLKRIKYSRLPSLSGFATGGLNRQDVQFMNLFKNTWYPYTMLGLNLNIPIVDFRSQYMAQQSKYNLAKTKNNITNLENVIKLETTSAKLMFNNSLKAMQNQKRNMELANEVVRVTRIKYQEGVGSNLEVVNAEADLQQAQINYYSAVYNAMITKVAYLKSTGTLYTE